MRIAKIKVVRPDTKTSDEHVSLNMHWYEEDLYDASLHIYNTHSIIGLCKIATL